MDTCGVFYRLYEDQSTNYWDESVELLLGIAGQSFFQESFIVVTLNHIDEFRVLISHHFDKFKAKFPNYQGTSYWKECLQYLADTVGEVIKKAAPAKLFKIVFTIATSLPTVKSQLNHLLTNVPPKENGKTYFPKTILLDNFVLFKMASEHKGSRNSILSKLPKEIIIKIVLLGEELSWDTLYPEFLKVVRSLE